MKKFRLRHSTPNPFNRDLELFTSAMTGDGFNVRFVEKVPMGAEACCDQENKTIMFPMVDPNKFNENQAHKMMGFSAHERKHARLTDIKSLKDLTKLMKKRKHSSDLLHILYQIIEDCRIEMNEKYAMPGDLYDLAWLRSEFADQLIMDESEILKTNPMGWTIHCFQYDLLKEHPEFQMHKTLDVPNDPICQALYKSAWDILHDGRFEKSRKMGKGGDDITLELAKDIEKAWSEIVPPQPSGGGSGDGDEESESGSSGENGTSGEDKGSESSGDEGSENSKDAKEGTGKDKGKGKGNKSKGKDKRSAKEKIKDVNEAFSGMQDKKFMSPEKHKEEAQKISMDQGFIDEENDPKKIYEEQPKENSHFDAHSKYIGYNPHDNFVTAKPQEHEYRNTFDMLGERITHIRNMLAVRLKSMTQCQDMRFLRRGDLDFRNIYRTAKGLNDKNVFMKTLPGLEVSCAVSIVVDLSGSMAGRKSKLAQQMAILLAEVFHLLEIPFEVVGFNTNSTGGYASFEYRSRNNSRHSTNEYINFWTFKAFGDNYYAGETRYRLGSIQGTGCNVDHEVIQWAAGRLWDQPQKRKLMLVLSDGIPSGHHGNYCGALDRELKAVNDKILASGMEQFAFGLCDEGVRSYYKNYSILHNLEDLNEASLRVVADYLTQGMNQVRP